MEPSLSNPIDRRRRIRERPWVNPYLKKLFEYPDYIYTFEDTERDVARVRALVLERDVLLEIGSGSGKHLIEQAERNPKLVAIGIELRYKRSVRTIEKAIKRGISNIVVFHTDGRVFDKVFPENSISQLHVNFPDPWAKKKQKKHRVLGSEFLEKAVRCLKPDGILSIKTDHRNYFDDFMTEFKSFRQFDVEMESRDLHNSEFRERNISSEFEELFRSKGEPVCWLRARCVK